MDDFPEVTMDGSGRCVAVWQTDDELDGTAGTDYDLLVSHSFNRGVDWSPAVLLNTNGTTDSGDDKLPFVATDRLGHWVAVWHSWDSLEDTIGTESDILMSLSTNNGAIWTAPSALNTDAATDTVSNDRFPHLVTDGTGRWICTWASFDLVGLDEDIVSATAEAHFLKTASWSGRLMLLLALLSGGVWALRAGRPVQPRNLPRRGV